jgi:hypothetical protein
MKWLVFYYQQISDNGLASFPDLFGVISIEND